MTWRRYLQSRTRNPAFLWRMVTAILTVGLALGLAVDAALVEWAAADDSLADEFPPSSRPDWARLDQLAADGNWLAVWGGIPRMVMESWRQLGATLLAALTGACWLAFAIQAIQPRSRRDGRLWLPLVAAAWGVLSIWLTVFLIFWQEHRWGTVDASQLLGGLKHYLLGVALREEFAKFVCFLPLLPWCVRRRDELAALLLAGCVGIGFAMEENINYIAGTLGAATLTRLLMPAPLHMALTGLIGLAAYRACVWPREWGPLFVATFGVAVLAHGLYDAFSALPALAPYGIVSGIIFVGLIYQFFHELRPKQAMRVEPVSLTANFLFCVSTVAAATFVYLCAAVGWRLAGDYLVASVAAQGVMVYLFLREMPETMVTV